MNFLDKITKAESDLLIRLPYRVGYYVSQSDKTGGDESDDQELLALSNIIHGFADSMLGSEAIQYVMTETMNQKKHWPDWGAKLAQVPKECRAGIRLVHAHLDKKDVAAFQNHLMEIGEAVALAFREIDLADEEKSSVFEKLPGPIRDYMSRLKEAKGGGGPRYSGREFINISPDEREALEMLAKGLGAKI